MKWPDPLSKQSDELVENYPLTKEELRLIAAVWTAVRFSSQIWCELVCTGCEDEHAAEYAADRLTLAAEILGEEEMRSAYGYVVGAR